MKRTLVQKGQLYQQLYNAYNAGLLIETLIANMTELPGAQSVPRQTAIMSGKTLASALLARKLIGHWEAQLLKMAESSGRLETVLLDLQTFYEERSWQFRNIKSRLRYPVIILLFAIVIPPLPLLASGTWSMSGYVFITASKSLSCMDYFSSCSCRPSTKPAIAQVTRNCSDY